MLPKDVTNLSVLLEQTHRRFAEIRRAQAETRAEVRQTISRIRERQKSFVRMARIERTRRGPGPDFRKLLDNQTSIYRD